MTSASTAPPLRLSLVASPEEAVAGAPGTRPPARFPRPARTTVAAPTRSSPAASAPLVFDGPDGSLKDLVRDRAAAVGLALVDGPERLAGLAPGPTGGTLLGLGAAAQAPLLARILTADSLRSGPADRLPRGPGAAALDGSAADGPSPGGAPPTLVVLEDGEVPEELWRAALASGAWAVLRLPSESTLLLEHLAALHRPERRGLVIGVVGGCGGAGASSFAARLAGALRQHGPVALLDADPQGGGLDLLVEAPDLDGVRWDDLAAIGPDDAQALHEGLPEVDGVRLLVSDGGDGPSPDPDLLSRVLAASAAGAGSTVVDLAGSLVPAVREQLDLVLAVVPTTVLGVRAASRRLRAWSLPSAQVRIVVRRTGPLEARDVVDRLGVPAVAVFRDGPGRAVPLLDVRRRGADRACRDLARALAPAEAVR
ncbi:septum site-determining protein Ssd [Brachybacterium sp. DNPG3]